MQNQKGSKTAESPVIAGAPHEPMEVKLSRWFPKLTDSVIKSLALYHSEFLGANRTLNLIPTGAVKNLESMYFADSVLASNIIRQAMVPGAVLWDLGGSGGFPGFVFAILFPAEKVTLLEREADKIDFYRRAAARIGIKNLSFEMKGLDELADPSVSNVVIRGSAPLSKTLLAYRKLIANGGRFFHLKTDSWTAEVSVLPSQVFTVWSPSLAGQYRVPETSVDMAVVLTEKIGS